MPIYGLEFQVPQALQWLGYYKSPTSTSSWMKTWLTKSELKETKLQVKKDITRTHLFKGTSPSEYFDGWNLDKEFLYIQGDPKGGLFAETMHTYKFLEELEKDPDKLADPLAKKVLSFGYITDGGQRSGITITWEKDNPERWAISVMKNPEKADLSQRKVNIFYSEIYHKNNVFPKPTEMDGKVFQNALFEVIDSKKITTLLKDCIQEDKFITEKLILFEESNLFKPETNFTSHWLHQLFFEESTARNEEQMLQDHKRNTEEPKATKDELEENHIQLESIRFQITELGESSPNTYKELLQQEEAALMKKDSQLRQKIKNLENLLAIIDNFAVEIEKVEESKRKDAIIKSIEERFLLIQTNPQDFLKKIETINHHLSLSEDKSEVLSITNPLRHLIIDTLKEQVEGYKKKKIEKYEDKKLHVVENNPSPLKEIQLKETKQKFELIKTQLSDKNTSIIEKTNKIKLKKNIPVTANENKIEILEQAISYIIAFQQNTTIANASQNTFNFALNVGILKSRAEEELKENISYKLSKSFFREETTLSLINKLFTQSLGLIPNREKKELLIELNKLKQSSKDAKPIRKLSN